MSSNNTTAGPQVTRSTGNTTQHEGAMPESDAASRDSMMTNLIKETERINEDGCRDLKEIGIQLIRDTANLPNSEQGAEEIQRLMNESGERIDAKLKDVKQQQGKALAKAYNLNPNCFNKESVKQTLQNTNSTERSVQKWACAQFSKFHEEAKRTLINLASLIVGIRKSLGHDTIVKMLSGTAGFCAGAGVSSAFGSGPLLLVKLGITLNPAIISGVSVVVAGGLLLICCKYYGYISVPWLFGGLAVGAAVTHIAGEYVSTKVAATATKNSYRRRDNCVCCSCTDKH